MVDFFLEIEKYYWNVIECWNLGVREYIKCKIDVFFFGTKRPVCDPS